MKYKDYDNKWKNRPIRMSDELWEICKKKAKKLNIPTAHYLRELVEKDNI